MEDETPCPLSLMKVPGKNYSAFFRAAFFFGAGTFTSASATGAGFGALDGTVILCFLLLPNVPRNNFPLRDLRSPLPMI